MDLNYLTRRVTRITKLKRRKYMKKIPKKWIKVKGSLRLKNSQKIADGPLYKMNYCNN